MDEEEALHEADVMLGKAYARVALANALISKDELNRELTSSPT